MLIRAPACGTPVVAYNRGSVPEIIRNGVTGFVVRDLTAATRAISQIPNLSRRACRLEFETRFTAPRMAQAYVFVYRKVLRFRTKPPELTARAG